MIKHLLQPGQPMSSNYQRISSQAKDWKNSLEIRVSFMQIRGNVSPINRAFQFQLKTSKKIKKSNFKKFVTTFKNSEFPQFCFFNQKCGLCEDFCWACRALAKALTLDTYPRNSRSRTSQQATHFASTLTFHQKSDSP